MRVYGSPPSGLFRAVDRGSCRAVFLGHVLATERELRTAPIRELPGAYSCVIVTADRVELHTDRAGQFPFHFSVRGHETLTAHHATLLAALHSRVPDPLSAAIQIVCPNVLALTMGRSFFTDVGRYENTHHGPVVPLRAALVEAVRRRGPGVSADFSGGIDSTSLAFLAAAGGPVDAVVYHHDRLPAADLAAARRAAALSDRIRLSVVTGDQETLPYQGIDEAMMPDGRAWMPGFDLPPAPGFPAHRTSAGLDWPAPGILARRRAALRLDWARRRGAGSAVHLTGEGADALFQPPPSYLATLVRQGELRRWASHSARLSRLRQASALDLAVRAARLATTSHGRALRVLARSLTRAPADEAPGPADAVGWWSVPGQAAGWLTSGIRKDLSDLAGDPATARRLPAGLTPARHATLAALRSAAAAQRFLRTLGDHLGVAVHAPYLDDAVVGAVLDVPAPVPDPSRAKPLLADALTGLVPEPVLTRRTKGAYQAEEYAGARVARRRIAGLLGDSRLADLGVLDPAAVTVTLSRLNAGAPVPLSALGRLVALEVWLRG
ncbi:asparagine synthase-related protein [Herbidospora yilanensis]|uniref:asparagine synthase-related protein n=1 Tax=Herbidospora yilanensis TaxID=354426 RepID=UPI000780A35F|nr:asparagine synthase-related protein [Herbidospora yilanensis]